MHSIDGARKSGSGTIVRLAVALAALVGYPVRVFNARKERRVPGLRPQHAASILACAAVCNGTLFAAMARGTSRYLVPKETEQFGAHGRMEGRQVIVEGLALAGRQAAAMG